MPTSNFQPIRLLDLDCWYKFTYLMSNSADPDQLTSSEANWSGSTQFAAGQGLLIYLSYFFPGNRILHFMQTVYNGEN